MTRTTTTTAATRIAAIATLAAILAAALPAQAFVPGSDTAERARSATATHSVVLGTQQDGAIASRARYGYPQASATGTLVPASNHSAKILDAASTHSVVQGASGVTLQRSGSAVADGLIPGSDSFN